MRVHLSPRAGKEAANRLTRGEAPLAKVLDADAQRRRHARRLPGPAGHDLGDDVERQVEEGRHAAQPRRQERRRVGRRRGNLERRCLSTTALLFIQAPSVSSSAWHS